MDMLSNANAIIPLIIIIKLSLSEPDSYQAAIHKRTSHRLNYIRYRIQMISNNTDIFIYISFMRYWFLFIVNDYKHKLVLMHTRTHLYAKAHDEKLRIFITQHYIGISVRLDNANRLLAESFAVFSKSKIYNASIRLMKIISN